MSEAARGGRTLPFQALVSGPPQGQQRDLWRDADTHREAESSEAAVHIERRLLQTIIRGRGAAVPVHRNRQAIKSGDKGEISRAGLTL